MNNREFGNKGEDLACEYLIKNGYEIIERNKHFSKFCEIDIIAKYKNKMVFVEVKTRKTDSFGLPMEAITRTKFNNIKTGVMNYISENKINNYQIDVIGIILQPKLKIEHLKNVSL
ncbi:MAG: YraN family protein [Candidatus Gastranaerophilales bacterium]|nr:YraN family protein [Candidatus Gastranaerophilales bacterium]